MAQDQLLMLDPAYLSDIEKSIVGALCLFSGPAYDFSVQSRLSYKLAPTQVNDALKVLVLRQLVDVVYDTKGLPMYWVTSNVLRQMDNNEFTLV